MKIYYWENATQQGYFLCQNLLISLLLVMLIMKGFQKCPLSFLPLLEYPGIVQWYSTDYPWINPGLS